MQQANRRCEQRIPVSRNLTADLDSTSYKGKLLDISHCGVGAIFHKAFEPNQIVNIRFSLPGYDQINDLNIKAMVAHITPFKGDFLIGFHFEKLTPHTQLVIKEYANFHQRFQA